MLDKIISSVLFALEGILFTIKTQLNFKIEILFVFLLCLTYYVIEITLFEWLMVILSLGFVLVSEIINTALEVTCDLISQKYNLKVKHIKDVADGSVLLCLFVVVSVNAIIIYKNILI